MTVCEWFALCDNPAVGTLPHPVLGDVPVCDRCADKVGLTEEIVREHPVTRL
jgi:hypothetical protein